MMDDPGVWDGKPTLLDASPRFPPGSSTPRPNAPLLPATPRTDDEARRSPISTGRMPCLPLEGNAMRRILFVLTLLAALVPTAGQSASAQVAPLAPFSGYSTRTAVHAGALPSAATR